MGHRHVLGWHYAVLALIVTISAMGVLWLSGWSFLPFGKRYLPDYYFVQLHEHHKNYFSEGARLVLLNGVPVDSLWEKQRVGVARAARIVEYSSSKAIERFGDAGKYGATEIMGERAEWIVSDAVQYRRSYDKSMVFTHSGVALPGRMNPRHDAIYVAGESTDTLYLGVVSYRHIMRDTINKVIVVNPSKMFFVNTYKRNRRMPDRPLLIFRNGELEASLMGANIESMGEGGPYFYDDRVVAFSRWVDNTVSAVMKRHPKTGKVKDSRLVVTNGDVQEREHRLSRVQTTQGTVTYLNGVDAVKMYGWKRYAGAVMVTGNTLKFFGQLEE